MPSQRAVAVLLISILFSGCSGRSTAVSGPGAPTVTPLAAHLNTTPEPAHAWWDDWPRFTNLSSSLADVQDIHASAITASNGLADEGRGPYFREMSTRDSQPGNGALEGAGIPVTAWIEGMGETRAIIGAIHQLPDGSYEQDPAYGAAKVEAHNWTWDYTGPGTANADANKVVWFSAVSYADQESWLGPFTLGDPAYAIPTPVYVDGTPALGFNGDPSDPRNAKLYDAAASKSVGGSVFWECGQAGTNATGKLMVDCNGNGTPVPTGDFSIGKDVGSPWWLAYNEAATQYFIAHGVRGFWEDNSSGWDFIRATPTVAAFGEFSVVGFRDFARAHGGLGIANPDTFDIRQYLQSKAQSFGASPSDAVNPSWPGWSDARFLADPIWMAYLAHKSNLAGAYQRSLYSGIKAQAKAAGLDPAAVFVGGNDVPLLAFGMDRGQELDQADCEFSSGPGYVTGAPGVGLPPVGGHAGPFYSVAAGYQNSQHATVWYYLDDAAALPYQNHTGLGELLGYEALANNVILSSDPGNGQFAGSRDSVRNVNALIEQLTPTLGYRTQRGGVALVYSTQTQYSFLTPGGFLHWDATSSDPQNPTAADHSLGFFGWGAALEEMHVPYRAIPDFKLSASALQGISLLVMPHVRSVDPSWVQNTLAPFLRSGGIVLVTGADSGALGTVDQLFQPNSGPLVYQLTQADYAPGKAIFLAGNPGLDFYAGRTDATQTRRQSALNVIAGAVGIQLAEGRAPRESVLSGWGPKVRVTHHASWTGQEHFFDFVNADVDLASDQFAPSGGGAFTFSIPSELQGVDFPASWYSDDTPGAQALTVTRLDDRRASVQVPGFRGYGLLTLGRPNAPAITAAGPGCDDLFCIWITGIGFSPSSQVRLSSLDGSTLYATYQGTQLSVQSTVITLALAAGSVERGAFAAQGLRVQVVDPAQGAGSNSTSVYQQTPAAPQLSAAGSGCADQFCIWITGSGFLPNAVVDVLDPDTGLVQEELSGSRLSIQPTVVTLALTPHGAARQMLADRPVQVRVSVPGAGASGLATSVRSVDASVARPQIQSAGPGCSDGSCIWVVGQGFSATSEVLLYELNGDTPFADYAGTQISWQPASSVITLRLTPASVELAHFLKTGVRIRVLEGASGGVSDSFDIATHSPPAPPDGPPRSAP